MKIKKFISVLVAILLCFTLVSPFAACNNDTANEKSELERMKESYISDITNYPSKFDYPQLMTLFYQDIVDGYVAKINAATATEKLRGIYHDFTKCINNTYMDYRAQWLSFDFQYCMYGYYHMSGTFEDKPYYINSYLTTTSSSGLGPWQRDSSYYSEDTELSVKDMAIINNDVNQSGNFMTINNTAPAFPDKTTHYAFILTKGDKVVGIHLQTFNTKMGNTTDANKYIANGIFQTPITESEAKTYIQTIIDGKTPPADNKLTPQNASFIYNMNETHIPFYVVSENDTQRAKFTVDEDRTSERIVYAYSDSALAYDENGSPVNQKTINPGDTFEISKDFPNNEYVIITVSKVLDPTTITSEIERTFIFQMQQLDENIYSGSGRQMSLVAICNANFFSLSERRTEHDTTFALAVGKYLVNQLKNGASPENLEIG